MGAIYVRTPPTRQCWHCRWFVAMSQGCAVCSLQNGYRSRAMPENGCSAWQREPGADDEPGPPPGVSFLDGWRLMPTRVPRPATVQQMLAEAARTMR